MTRTISIYQLYGYLAIWLCSDVTMWLPRRRAPVNPGPKFLKNYKERAQLMIYCFPWPNSARCWLKAPGILAQLEPLPFSHWGACVCKLKTIATLSLGNQQCEIIVGFRFHSFVLACFFVHILLFYVWFTSLSCCWFPHRFSHYYMHGIYRWSTPCMFCRWLDTCFGKVLHPIRSETNSIKIYLRRPVWAGRLKKWGSQND